MFIEKTILYSIFSNDVIENCLIEEEIDTIENINLFMALTIQKFLEFLDVVVKQ